VPKIAFRLQIAVSCDADPSFDTSHVPAAAIAWNASRDFFSARIGCQGYQPVYGMDIAALCLRR
jgi:hypothetical protein